MTVTTIDRVCEHCGTTFQAQRRSARFCCEAHRKAAARARTKPAPVLAVVPSPWTLDDVLENIDAMVYLLAVDMAELESRCPTIGEDPVMDELIGGLETHKATVTRLRAWIVERVS